MTVRGLRAQDDSAQGKNNFSAGCRALNDGCYRSSDLTRLFYLYALLYSLSSLLQLLCLLTGFCSRVLPVTAPELQTGVVISKVVCAGHAEQSYSLYLPSAYTSGRRWPIVFVFDPLARGDLPVRLMKDAAERYGFIVAGSNNSRNGSWKVQIEAAQAMSADAQGRLSVDTRRVYFAGLSGGARFAAALAQRCGCAAGVILNSAGFTPAGAAVRPGEVFLCLPRRGVRILIWVKLWRWTRSCGNWATFMRFGSLMGRMNGRRLE